MRHGFLYHPGYGIVVEAGQEFDPIDGQPLVTFWSHVTFSEDAEPVAVPDYAEFTGGTS